MRLEIGDVGVESEREMLRRETRGGRRVLRRKRCRKERRGCEQRGNGKDCVGEMRGGGLVERREAGCVRKRRQCDERKRKNVMGEQKRLV